MGNCNRRLEASTATIFAALFAFGCGAPLPGEEEDLGESQQLLVGAALPGLTAAQLTQFNEGREAFAEEEDAADGLGPGFNDVGCAVCHSAGSVGGGSKIIEKRIGRLTNGVFNPLANEGGELLQLKGLGTARVPGCNFNGEVVPADANVVAGRRTTPLFGLGFVDSTPDSTFEAIAAAQPAAIRGRTNRVFTIQANATTVGKFGWKSQVPTLFQFSGDAYLNEMGITNPQFPRENVPNGSQALLTACDKIPELEDDGDDVVLFNDFMRLLAAPVPIAGTNETRAGDQVFVRIGCEGCHVRTIRSGNSSVAALSNKDYHPFSDFLLHDMGPLGDGIPTAGRATGREMRTAPLWGMQFIDKGHLLHDGRANAISLAIELHDGQAAASRDKFRGLNGVDKANLVAFIKSL